MRYSLQCSIPGDGINSCFEVLMKLKLTNRLELPEAIVKAISNDPYDKGSSEYTATSLLKPARMAQLMKTAEVIEDAADHLYSLQGQVMHLILERAGDELRAGGYIVEKRFEGTYFNNIRKEASTVSAQIDIFDPKNGVLSDYKYTSVASSKHGLKKEHLLQLSLQADLLRLHGHKVNKAEVILLLRDWSAERTYEGYPESPVIKQEVPLLGGEEVAKWVLERVKTHEDAKVKLPECTEEERWANPTYAVKNKESDVRALRVFDTLQEAEDYVQSKDKSIIIQKREGISRRCLRYCPVRSVCEQAKKYELVQVKAEEGFIKVS